jgi:enoyl-CoA hydratase
VARVVPHEQLIPTTEDVVRELLFAAPRARVALKRLINARYGAIDRITFDESVHGEEVVEGFRAFVEKRTPAWVPETDGSEGRA